MTMFGGLRADIPPGRNPEPETVPEISWVVKLFQCGVGYREEAVFARPEPAYRFVFRMNKRHHNHRRVFKRTEVLCEERGSAGGGASMNDTATIELWVGCDGTSYPNVYAHTVRPVYQGSLEWGYWYSDDGEVCLGQNALGLKAGEGPFRVVATFKRKENP